MDEYQATVPKGYAGKYLIPVKVQPRYSREEMMAAIADNSSESSPALPLTDSSGSSSPSEGSPPVPRVPLKRVRSISEVYRQDPEKAKRLMDNESVSSNKTQIRLRDSPTGSDQ